MTYSIIVTISFIVLLVLFVRSVTRIASLESILESNAEKHQATEATLARKAKELVEDKESLRRQIRYLESLLNDEKDRIMGKSELIATQRERMKALRAKNNKLTDELLLTSDLKSVRFSANIPGQGWTRTEFKLGLGPCGLNVKSLRWTETPERYIIEQLCTNGERKEFVYEKSDVAGRIEFRRS